MQTPILLLKTGVLGRASVGGYFDSVHPRVGSAGQLSTVLPEEPFAVSRLRFVTPRFKPAEISFLTAHQKAPPARALHESSNDIHSAEIYGPG